jgi:hypothetical protein
VRIHAIQAGTVAVTSAWREGVGRGKRPLGRSGFHFDLINRIDGVKMLALAAMASGWFAERCFPAGLATPRPS